MEQLKVVRQIGQIRILQFIKIVMMDIVDVLKLHIVNILVLLLKHLHLLFLIMLATQIRVVLMFILTKMHQLVELLLGQVLLGQKTIEQYLLSVMISLLVVVVQNPLSKILFLVLQK